MSWECFYYSYERSESNTKETSIAKSLYNILADDPYPNELKDLIRNCDSPKLKVLWEILFETGIEEVDLLENRIYQYGGMIKDQDYVGREIFMGMISLLKEIKRQHLQ